MIETIIPRLRYLGQSAPVWIGLLVLGCGADSRPAVGASGSGGTDTHDASLEGGGSEVTQSCEQPDPLFQDEPDQTSVSSSPTTTLSGMTWCDDESYHRVEAVTCIEGWERVPDCSCDGQDIDAGTGCYDSQCYRIQGCATSDDCGADEVCLCSAGRPGYRYNHNTCVPADCETDADCNGYECGVSSGPSCSQFTLRCHTADDECHGNAQCPADRHVCAYTGARWECIMPDTCE
jgi:hypothetical protein